jgi:hypothetical protein
MGRGTPFGREERPMGRGDYMGRPGNEESFGRTE